MTKAKAIEQLKGFAGVVSKGYVYQFEKGHWGYATFDSPIGADLRASDMTLIYAAQNIRAKQVVEISI